MAKATFDAKRLNAFAFDPDDLVIIEKPKDALYDPREALPVDEALVENIKAVGVIQAVVVAKDGDKAVVVDGRQRVKAAREANRRLREEGQPPLLVPCVARKGDEATLFGLSVSANEFRHEEDVIGKAQKARRLLDFGRTEKDVAILFGVTCQCIKNWLALLGTSKEVQDAVKSRQINATSAQKLAKLSREKQVEKLAEIKANGKTTSKAVEKMVRGESPATPRMRTKDEIKAKLKELEGLKGQGTEGIIVMRQVSIAMLKWVLGEA